MQLAKYEVCQHMKRKVTTGIPQLNSIPVKSPWYVVGIDFVAPISPAADDGSEYILTEQIILQSGVRLFQPLTNQLHQ